MKNTIGWMIGLGMLVTLFGCQSASQQYSVQSVAEDTTTHSTKE